ncbi:MAG: DUF3579 domain-containing protein [Gammaproteobacteria bacterium]|nr:DUF3579 domain-containing protein [Gammaproteobacteria bacterium]
MGVSASVSVDERDSVVRNQAALNNDEWKRQIRLRLSSFEYEHRLKLSLDVRPCFIDGMPSLTVPPDLEIRDPFAFAYIQRFVQENALNIVLDRRTQRECVAIERRAA